MSGDLSDLIGYISFDENDMKHISPEPEKFNFDLVQKFCLTGKIGDYTRSEIVKALPKGVTYATSLDNTVDALVVGRPTNGRDTKNTSKYKKAEAMDIPIVTADEFMDWFAGMIMSKS